MKNIEYRNEQIKINPRYDIERMSDKDGLVSVFFQDAVVYQAFLDGKKSIASTERFLPNDLIISIPGDRISKITDGGTLAHIPAISLEQEEVVT